MRAKDLTGQEFGTWIVDAREGSISGRANWLVHCVECGYETHYRSDRLIQDSTGPCPQCRELNPRLCEVVEDGQRCERKHSANGMCNPHYQQWYAGNREAP